MFYIGRGGADSAQPVVTDWNNPDIGKGKGEIHVYDPKTKKVTLAGALTVFGNKGGGDELIKIEEGLLGIELDPDFADQRLGVSALHAALADQPRHAHGRAARLPLHPGPRDQQARPGQREGPAEVAGADPQLLPRGRRHGLGLQGQPLHRAPATTTPSGFSGGYSGNNPQPNYKGVSFADARRTAGNTNNLNGKILRIHPEADGTYTLPEGNLFTGKEPDEGGGKTRGEIYVMGVRNPARIFVDKTTDTLYAGWVGPDAGAPSTDLGPGQVRHLRRHHQGGQPRLAVLHGQQAALPRPQPARPEQAAGLVRLRRTRRTSRRTTTAW